MPKTLLILDHHQDDYECMWNGIEDLYMRDTQEILPPKFFFTLASFGSLCYMKTPKSNIKRLFRLADGRTKPMYKFLAPVVGFEYRHFEYRTFEQALKKAKTEIDAGYPAVLGALDMYHLPYYQKLYHFAHIPIHYVLMTGYDDAAECIDLLDCGRKEAQTLSYSELRKAWDCCTPALSKPNTVCAVRMGELPDKYKIAKSAIQKRAGLFLHSPVNFTGRKGFERFIAEFPTLQSTLSEADYKALLTDIVTYFGMVPMAPNALQGIPEPDAITYYGGFDTYSCVLHSLGVKYNNKAWISASEHIAKGSMIIEEITQIIVAYLVGSSDNMADLPRLFTQVMEILTNEFTLLTA